MRIIDRRAFELLPNDVLRALNRLEQAVLTTDWRRVQVTMERKQDFEELTTIIDILIREP